MFKELLTSLGRLYSFFMSLIVAIILGVTTWAFWGVYQDARLQSQFTKEGQLVSVKINEADNTHRSWRDVLGNSVYLTFDYKGKAYTTRYVRESAYIGGGDRVQLLYHPGYDAFRQPGDEMKFARSTRKSRLIDWTTIYTFSNNNRLLLLCLLLTIASFFVISGFIATVLPVPFLQQIARFVFIAVLFVATIFLSYDGWKYYQYYQHIKANGQMVTVRVLDTDRKAIGNYSGGRHSGNHWYNYEATIRYQQRERVIPISKHDFETVKRTDPLKALYDKSLDDFMSVDFGFDYTVIVVPLTFFALTIFLVTRSGSTRKKT